MRLAVFQVTARQSLKGGENLGRLNAGKWPRLACSAVFLSHGPATDSVWCEEAGT